MKRVLAVPQEVAVEGGADTRPARRGIATGENAIHAFPLRRGKRGDAMQTPRPDWLRGCCPRRPATERFRAAVQDPKIGPDKDIPHVPPRIIVKYITNLDGSDCY